MTARARFTAAIRRPHRIAICVASALLALCGIAVPASAATPPTLTTNSAEEVGVTTTKLSGTVNPHGEAGSANTAWRIQYAPLGTEAWSTANEGPIEAPASEEASPVSVEAIFGFSGELQPGQSYEFRIVAERGAEVTETPLPYPTFTMAAAEEPALATEPATEAGYSLATLHGTVDPEGGNSNPIGGPLPIEWYLQYAPINPQSGEPEAFENGGSGLISAEESEGGGPIPAESTEPIAIEAPLAPGTLNPNREYEVRVLAFWLGGARSSESAEPFEEFETKTALRPTVIGPAATLLDAEEGAYRFNAEVGPSSPKSATEIAALEASGEPAKVREAEDLSAAFLAHWRFECEPGCGAPGGEIAADDTLHPVEAEVKGLQANTEYTLALHTETRVRERIDRVTFKTPAVAPLLTTPSSVPLDQHSSDVAAYLTPRNTQITDCHFLYGPTTAYGSEAPCKQSLAELGSGGKAVQASAELTGLTSGSTYHIELLASSAAGSAKSADGLFEALSPEEEEACPNEARRAEQHAGYLPDCRAYELASPADKGGADVMGEGALTRAAADGNAISFASLGGFADAQGTGISTEYISERDPSPATSGWVSHAITPIQQPLTLFADFHFIEPFYEGALSPDLNKGVFRAWSPVTDEDPNVENVENFYLRDDLRSPGPGSYQLVSPCPLCAETGPLPPSLLRPRFVAASSDFSHLIFESTFGLVHGASPNLQQLYEWANGTLSVVNQVPPAGQPVCGAGGPTCESALTASAGQGGIFDGNLTPHVISADGLRVNFTAEETNLYQRVDGTSTVQVNLPDEGASAAGPTAATYWDASLDGTKILFTSAQQLTPDDTNSVSDLYLWNATASLGHRLTRLSVDHEPSDDEEPVTGVIGASDDASYVYFVSPGQLIAGQPTAEAGERSRLNIYEWHNGTLTLVSRLSEEVIQGNLANSPSIFPQHYSAVTPDGRHLLFATEGGDGVLSLHGGTDYTTAGGSVELYRFDAATGSIQCVSCRPGGGSPTTTSNGNVFNRTTGVSTGATPNTNRYLDHNLSVDGRFVFFTSTEDLLPSDTDGAPDAYEYDARTGTLHLLSSGTDERGSYFMDASPDGQNAFILAGQRLLGWDSDQGFDLYDARVGGGLPEPAPQPSPCVGEAACKDPSPPPPPHQSPSSSTVEAPGNPPVSRRCKKKSVRHHGRCVSPRHHHRSHYHRRGGR